MIKFPHVLKNRNFFLLWIGQIISQLGDRLNQMALIGFITQHSPGKTLQLATLISITILPVFVIGPLAGVYVDRWDRRKTMYLCDLVRGILVLLIPLYILDGKNAIVPLYVVVFILFSIGRFFVPAKLAIIPDMVDNKQLLLANSLVNTTGMIAATIGFGIGGIVVAVMGVKGGFYLDAGSFFVSSLLIFCIRPKSSVALKIVKISKEIVEVIRKSVLTEIKEGILYLVHHKEMRMMIDVLFLLWAALGAVYVVIIVFVQQTLHSITKDLGLLIMFLGIGLFFGSLLYGHMGRSKNCLRTIFLSLAFSGMMLMGFVFFLTRFPHFYTAAGLAVVLGMAISPIMTATNTLIHDTSDHTMRGKVFSSVEIVMHMAFLLFMFLSSGLAQLKGVGNMGLLIVVGMLLVLIGSGKYVILRVRNA